MTNVEGSLVIPKRHEDASKHRSATQTPCSFFTQDTLLDRVPGLFLLQATIFLVMQLVGVLLVTNPHKRREVSCCNDSPKQGLKFEALSWNKHITDERTIATAPRRRPELSDKRNAARCAKRWREFAAAAGAWWHQWWVFALSCAQRNSVVLNVFV